MPTDVNDNAEYIKTMLPMPVLAVGAQGAFGDFVANQVRRYATNLNDSDRKLVLAMVKKMAANSSK